MKKISALLLLCIFLTSTLIAEEKSKALAIMMSAALPGTGEMYAAKKTSAFVSLTAEAIIWLNFLGFKEEERWAERDYKSYAAAYSGNSAPDGTDIHYKLLQKFYSSDEYNNGVKIYARYYLENKNWTLEEYNTFLEENLYDGDKSWKWSSKKTWYRFNDMKQRKNTYDIMAQLAVGAMVVNRIVSVIKAIHATNTYNHAQKIQPPLVNFRYGLDVRNRQLMFALEKKF